MVAFAGYELPVQYPTGILKEHLHTRAAAGLFDVSHMGQIVVRPRSGDARGRGARRWRRWCRWTSLGLTPGRQRYALFTDEAGGILDDLMVANRGDHLLLVVNAACKARRPRAPRGGAGRGLQRRDARPGAARAAGAAGRGGAGGAQRRTSRAMRFMDVRALELGGVAAIVSRSGYTGEDGFEISLAERETRSTSPSALLATAGRAAGRARRARLAAARGGALPLRPRHRPRRRRRSRRRSSGRSSRRAAAGGARAGRLSRRRRRSSGRSPRARRGGASGSGPRGRAPMREGTELFAERGAARRSGGSPRAASGRASTRRWRWATCRSRRRRRRRGSSGGCAGRCCRSTVARMPFIAPGYRRALSDGRRDGCCDTPRSTSG